MERGDGTGNMKGEEIAKMKGKDGEEPIPCDLCFAFMDEDGV